MTNLTRALAFRTFGTRRLALASTLRLAGLTLLLYTLPGVLRTVGLGLYVFVYYSIISTVFYFFTFIVPILALLANLLLLPGFLILFVRGYFRLATYYLAWMRQQYALAKDDLHLNTLFAESNS